MIKTKKERPTDQILC